MDTTTYTLDTTSYLVIDITTGRTVIGLIGMKSAQAAKCYAAKHHYGRFHRVYAV